MSRKSVLILLFFFLYTANLLGQNKVKFKHIYEKVSTGSETEAFQLLLSYTRQAEKDDYELLYSYYRLAVISKNIF